MNDSRISGWKRGQMLWLGCGLLLLSACAEPPYNNVSNQQLQQLIEQGVQLIDIRTSPEWRETGVVPGSHKITFFEANGSVNPRFFSRLESLISSADQPIAIICRTGNRTAALGSILAGEMGYKVYNLERGITNWIAAGNAVTR